MGPALKNGLVNTLLQSLPKVIPVVLNPSDFASAPKNDLGVCVYLSLDNVAWPGGAQPNRLQTAFPLSGLLTAEVQRVADPTGKQSKKAVCPKPVAAN